MAANPFVKRLFDIVLSLAVLIVFSPLLITAALCVWVQDFRSPLYLAPRVARGGGSFTMIKLRSMVECGSNRGKLHRCKGRAHHADWTFHKTFQAR